jgi:hypothetical protein
VNLADTSNLLTFIARCDNRRVDDATAIAWQSILADLDLDDCLAAAREHFATSDAYLMPVHIRRGAHKAAQSRREALYATGWRCPRCDVDNRADTEVCRQCGADPHQAIETGRDRSADVAELLREIRDRLPAVPTVSPLRRPEVARWDAARGRHRADIGPNPEYDPTAHARLAAMENPQ